MKIKKINFYQVFILLIIIAAILASLFVNYHKNSKEEEYLKEDILTLDMAYYASIDKYRLFTNYVLNESINEKLILSLFERGVNSTDDVRRLYKGLLYKEVYPLYERLKKEGIRQLHFHTNDNKSYLRFHKPDKYGDDLTDVRETIKIANRENRVVTSFETGRVISGFRNVASLF